MTETTTISAMVRDRAGKGAARATRRAGRIPGVIYGGKQSPICISIEPKWLKTEMHKPGFLTRLFDIDLGKAGTHRTLPRDVQLDPVTDQPLHVDFLRITSESVVHVAVPVSFINEALSPGLKRGGVLNIVRHEIELYCKPDDIPHSLVVDLAGLEIGDSVHISHIKLPAGATPTITDRDFTVASVAAPTVTRGGEAGA